MKIFHTEKSKEVVYVQMQDLAYLISKSNITAPASIYAKIYADVFIVYESNRFDFVRFDEDHEVLFFREQEFIVDLDKYKDLSKSQLIKEYNKIIERSNKIAIQYNGMTQEEKKQNESLYYEHQNLVYMSKSIFKIYEVKRGKIRMPFPHFVKVPKFKRKIFKFKIV